MSSPFHIFPRRWGWRATSTEASPESGSDAQEVLEVGAHDPPHGAGDAGLVGEFLKEKALSRGATYIPARVVDVHVQPNGDIDALLTDEDEKIEGDFFIDCSGFRGTLIQKFLHVPFVSYAENLFNDSAVVLPTGQEDRIGSQTVSTALSYGWAWQIPLTHRIGNGYVYSSSFCSEDAAEKELREHLIAGWTEEQIRDSWQEDLDAFKAIRAKYLIYP